MATEIPLKSLIDAQVLQHLQDTFAAERSVSIAVFDESGHLLTSPSRSCPVPDHSRDYLSPFVEFILTWPPNLADLGVQDGNKIFSSFLNGLIFRAILPLAAPNRVLGAVQVIMLDSARAHDIPLWQSALEGFSFNYISYLAFIDSYSMATNDRMVRLCTQWYEQLEALLEAGYSRATKTDQSAAESSQNQGGDIVTTPDHDIIRVDPSAAAFLGYDHPDQLLGLNVFEAIIAQPDDRDNIRHFLEIRGELADYPLFLQDRAGHLLPAKIRIRHEDLGEDVPAGFRYLMQPAEEGEIQAGDVLDLASSPAAAIDLPAGAPGRIEWAENESPVPIPTPPPGTSDAQLPDLSIIEMFDTVTEPQFIIDPFNRVVLWNTPVASLLDIPAPAVIGSDFGYLLVGESQSRWQQWLFNFRLDPSASENHPREPVQIIDSHGDVWTAGVRLGKLQIKTWEYITATLTSCRPADQLIGESAAALSESGESFRIVLPSSPQEQLAASAPLLNKLVQDLEQHLAAIQHLAQPADGGDTDREARDRASQILGRCDQMIHRMTLLHYAANPIPLRRQAVDITKLLTTITTVQQPLFSAPYLMNVDIQPDLHPLQGDSLLLQQAMLLLLDTVRSAMPDGGTISLIARNSLLPDEDGFHPPEDRTIAVQLEIAYPVCHLAETALKRLFEPFSENQKLEWAAAHGIVRHHGGQIEVISDAVQGTRFRIYLPALEPEAERSEKTTTGTVLIIDDEEGIIETARLILEEESIEVLAARSLTEGLQLLQQSDRIDCILLDIMLPDGEAPESVLRIREYSSQPIILSSGYPPDEEISAILPRCGGPFLQKSYRRNTLLKTIRPFLRPL